ncbi:arsenate reductase/protein-tyrosine-phosphatase family protein [Occultella gossypii]|uniref:Low molecular weight phosphatase family protein n=1 Tax=Occultella gossypii TaxID=2800820 RepID=A0ABS7SGF9_9MICO|nr:low molecular weight phosphatase family protein [Occultella gossypii]MBZ2199137.1 low molecular weight phosphatase family protein [Occultella gossypii]
MTRPEHFPFAVLVICTGNICRSPAVERLLTAGLDASVYVRSAGTHAMVGEPISAPMGPLVKEAGANPDHFAARQVTENAVRQADLVLTMTREHRGAAVDLWPGAVRRTFTLREYARALGIIDLRKVPAGLSQGQRLAAVTPMAAVMRGQGQPHDPKEDDVIDPYRESPEVYRQAFEQLEPAVRTIVRVARGE